MAMHQFQFALRHSRLRGCRYRNLAVVCDVITRSSPAGITIAPPRPLDRRSALLIGSPIERRGGWAFVAHQGSATQAEPALDERLRRHGPAATRSVEARPTGSWQISRPK